MVFATLARAFSIVFVIVFAGVAGFIWSLVFVSFEIKKTIANVGPQEIF
jgi:hypothetical protein